MLNQNKTKMKYLYACTALIGVFLMSCNNGARKNSSNVPEQKKVEIPSFNADSAYSYVKQQVDFGARVPNTAAHGKCAVYLASKLKSMGAVVTQQKTELTAFDGTRLKINNIIGAFHPEKENRVLLLSHWDSRPWADHDSLPANRRKPVIAANDGASGVGVLLEIARNISKKNPSVGVDILLVDAEDYGMPDSQSSGVNSEDTWVFRNTILGCQPSPKRISCPFTVFCWTWVGGFNATFYREQGSVSYASPVVDKVWSKANELGFSNYFVNSQGGSIIDDHVYVNKLAGIPCIDIIDFNPNSPTGFNKQWHTTHDTMEYIDKNTLQAVGTTLMHVIFNE